jgi:hypothetical protein
MPERLWAVNASPIISLANIDHAHLLPNWQQRQRNPDESVI